jgi:RNase adaptor protein for sRNA GlmZ degradation
MKPIKLIYDKYENDLGLYYENMPDSENELITMILNLLPQFINNKPINLKRVIKIYTWGIKKTTGIETDITFDLTTFQTKIDPSLDVHSLNGLSEEIQNSIILHPKFINIITRIITMIEMENPRTIGFFCNHGKHRSVGWAELIKKYYYTDAKIKHVCKIRNL